MLNSSRDYCAYSRNIYSANRDLFHAMRIIHRLQRPFSDSHRRRYSQIAAGTTDRDQVLYGLNRLIIASFSIDTVNAQKAKYLRCHALPHSRGEKSPAAGSFAAGGLYRRMQGMLDQAARIYCDGAGELGMPAGRRRHSQLRRPQKTRPEQQQNLSCVAEEWASRQLVQARDQSRALPDNYFLAVTTRSTRRLIARPSLVSLEAMGLDSP